MLVSDLLFNGSADMRLTFRAWFGTQPCEEIDLDETEIVVALIRTREYTRCPDARHRLNVVEKKLLRRRV